MQRSTSRAAALEKRRGIESRARGEKKKKKAELGGPAERERENDRKLSYGRKRIITIILYFGRLSSFSSSSSKLVSFPLILLIARQDECRMRIFFTTFPLGVPDRDRAQAWRGMGKANRGWPKSTRGRNAGAPPKISKDSRLGSRRGGPSEGKIPFEKSDNPSFPPSTFFPSSTLSRTGAERRFGRWVARARSLHGLDSACSEPGRG